MQTITLIKPGLFSNAETAEPSALQPNEALVQVRRIGICGTDFHAFRGRQPFFSYPRILGHELGVEVIAIGSDVDYVEAGDRCSVEPYLNCGTCIACRRNRPNCCSSLQVLGVHIDGGMRERIVIPANKLHKSEVLTLDQLALVETLGIGAHAVARAMIEPGERALVLGAGPIGLATMQFAVEAGANVTVVDINEARLAFCRSHMGVAETLISSTAEETVKQLCELTNSDLPTIVFDATGNPASMESAFQYVAFGGRLVFVGLVQGRLSFDDPQFHRREMTLLATRNSTPSDFTRIIQLMEAGRIDTTPWITHRAAFADLPTQFETWLDPTSGVIKAMAEFV